MPKINQYEQQTRASNGQLGAGPMRSAGGLLEIGAEAADAVVTVRRREEAQQVAKALSDLRLKSTQAYLDAQGRAADDAADFTPGVLKQFDTNLEEVRGVAKTRGAQEALAEAARGLREEFGQRAMVFEASRRASSRIAKTKDAIDSVRATLELDPDQWGKAMQEQSLAIDAMQLDPEQRRELRAYLAKEGFEGGAVGVAKKNPRAALKALAVPKSGDPRFDGLNADQRRQIEAFAKSQLVDQVAAGIEAEYRVDARAGTKALTDLAKSDLPADLVNDVRAAARSRIGLLHAERREEYGNQVTALERSITQGTPAGNAEAQAATLYRRGAYSPEQYTNVLQAIDESRQRGAKKAALALSVEQAIATGQRLDPKDTDVVKAVDAWFTDAMETNKIQPGTDEWVNNAAALAQRTNILPPEAMSWARKTLLSGEPKLAVPAAEAMTRFADAAPAAYAYFDDPNLKAQADHIASQVRAGVAPAKAVENARALTDIPKARQDQLAAKYGKEKYAADNVSELQSIMNGDDAFDRTVFGSAPGATVAMQDEFDAQVRRYFDLTNGDIKRARDLAWKYLRGTYGVSTVNGKPETMKWAPELVFPGIDPSVIRSDIEASAKGAGITAPVRLTPSRATGDTRGLLWNLSTEDEDGVIEVLLDDKNRPLTYAIPTDTAAYKKAQEDAAAAAVAAARDKSAKAREMAESMSELGAFPGY